MANENYKLAAVATDLVDLIQLKINQVQAIATAGTNSDNCDEATLRGLLKAIDTILESNAELTELKGMLA